MQLDIGASTCCVVSVAVLQNALHSAMDAVKLQSGATGNLNTPKVRRRDMFAIRVAWWAIFFLFWSGGLVVPLVRMKSLLSTHTIAIVSVCNDDDDDDDAPADYVSVRGCSRALRLFTCKLPRRHEGDVLFFFLSVGYFIHEQAASWSPVSFAIWFSTYRKYSYLFFFFFSLDSSIVAEVILLLT